MKIAFIGQKGIPAHIGGVERYVDEVAVRMAKKGHEVFVYVRSYYTSKNLKIYKGVNIIAMPTIRSKHFDAITHTFLSTVHALFQGYDVIHYQSLGPSSLAWLPKLLLKKTSLVATYHSRDYLHKKWWLLAKIYFKISEKMIFRIPEKTIVVGKTLEEIGIQAHDAKPVFIPNGAESIGKVPSLKIFKKWNIKKGKYILAVSRLIPHKEIHTLISAYLNLRALGKISPDMKLVVVGGGTYTDEYVREIKSMAGRNKGVIFTGVQRGEKLNTLLKNAYCFVQPSSSEGMSLALLEAMGAGIAPIISDIKENTAVAKENAIIFRTGDTFDLMSKLEYIVNHPARTKAMGKKARQMVKEEYNWNKIVSEIESVYKDVFYEKSEKADTREMKQILPYRRGTWL